MLFYCWILLWTFGLIQTTSWKKDMIIKCVFWNIFPHTVDVNYIYTGCPHHLDHQIQSSSRFLCRFSRFFKFHFQYFQGFYYAIFHVYHKDSIISLHWELKKALPIDLPDINPAVHYMVVLLASLISISGNIFFSLLLKPSYAAKKKINRRKSERYRPWQAVRRECEEVFFYNRINMLACGYCSYCQLFLRIRFSNKQTPSRVLLRHAFRVRVLSQVASYALSKMLINQPLTSGKCI